MTINVATETLDITPSPRILSVIAEVDLKIHQCLAELVDNSLDELSRASLEDPTIERRVDIFLPRHNEVSRESFVSVSDNGRGMSVDQMRQSMKAGSSGNAMYGSLGLFGMGFNIATARLGTVTMVKTGRVGDDHWSIATINLRDMMQSQTFTVPLRHEPKGPNEHGTSISVTQLSGDTVDSLRKGSAVPNIHKALGRIYTYMLRDAENETFSGREVMGGLGLSLHVNGKAVQPVVPCIWDPSRSVSYMGQDIKAVQVIDRELQDANACMSCGNWDSLTNETCSQCGSIDLEQRGRRIKGWLGIQRYDSRSEFGVSFFRHGRCIVHNDPELFEYVSETGDRESEYPVELGRGRIVGEIHIDHIPVNVRKTDFDRTQRSWQLMKEVVRGEGPLTDKRAKDLKYEKNTSPLGKLFHAYRRYDPGRRYLVPGNGDKALAVQARDWGISFRKGLPEYQTDEIWYAAVERHEQIVAGRDEAVEDDTEISQWLQSEGLADLAPAQGNTAEPEQSGAHDEDRAEDAQAAEPVVKPETHNEKIERYKTHSILLPGMDKEVSIGTGDVHLTVYVTSGTELIRTTGEPGFDLDIKSGKVSVFVQKNHELVTKYGWSHAQIALVNLSEYLADPSRNADTADVILKKLIRQFPDLTLTPAAVRIRAEELIEDIRSSAAQVTAGDPDKYWRALTPQAKQAVQYAATQSDPNIDWNAAIESGDYGSYVVPEAVMALLDAHPEAILDGVMFKAHYSAVNDEKTQSLVLGRLKALLLDLDRALSLPSSVPGRELSRLSLSIEILTGDLAEGGR